jgi:periplasmic protein CpxP/Spy
MILKRFLTLTATGLVALGLSVYGAQASAQSGPSSDNGHGARRQRMSPDQQLERLSSTLNLTDAQQGQLRPILEARHQKTESLLSDRTLSQQDRRSKMRSLFEESNNQIRAVLNSDQQKKFDEIQQRRRDRMQKQEQDK